MPKSTSEFEHEAEMDRSAELDHVTVEYENAPSACTLYPRDCSEADLVTHWLTAEEGSFVDLADVR